MFVRFVVGEDSQDHRLLTGVITEARILRDNGELEDHEALWLQDIYDWLETNLPCPPFTASGWSWNSVCWFKDDAGEAVQRLWQIVKILRDHCQPVRVLRSDNPGKILYEDEYQVVVEEWRTL